MQLLEHDTLYYEVVGHIDFRDKIQIIKSSALRLYHPSTWFYEMERILNMIDGELRLERNRMIHDVWLRPEDPGLTTRKDVVRPEIAKTPSEATNSAPGQSANFRRGTLAIRSAHSRGDHGPWRSFVPDSKARIAR